MTLVVGELVLIPITYHVTTPATENTTTTNDNEEEDISKPILVVSTYGTDERLTKIASCDKWPKSKPKTGRG